MIYAHCFFFIIFNLLHYSHSLQSGYTCEKSVTVTCPEARIIIILEVTYSTECTNELNSTSIYPPSRCIGYYREGISIRCNGKDNCTIDNSFEQQPLFLIGKQANCAFQGQSINIEYSCVPDFYSNKLSRVDICSLQSVDDLKEGFIHTPNYSDGYPNNLTYTKQIPAPDSGHR